MPVDINALLETIRNPPEKSGREKLQDALSNVIGAIGVGLANRGRRGQSTGAGAALAAGGQLRRQRTQDEGAERQQALQNALAVSGLQGTEARDRLARQGIERRAAIEEYGLKQGSPAPTSVGHDPMLIPGIGDRPGFTAVPMSQQQHLANIEAEAAARTRGGVQYIDLSPFAPLFPGLPSGVDLTNITSTTLPILMDIQKQAPVVITFEDGTELVVPRDLAPGLIARQGANFRQQRTFDHSEVTDRRALQSAKDLADYRKKLSDETRDLLRNITPTPATAAQMATTADGLATGIATLIERLQDDKFSTVLASRAQSIPLVGSAITGFFGRDTGKLYRDLVDRLGRLRSGGAVTADEFSNFAAILLSFGDAFAPIADIEEGLNRIANDAARVARDIRMGRQLLEPPDDYEKEAGGAGVQLPEGWFPGTGGGG